MATLNTGTGRHPGIQQPASRAAMRSFILIAALVLAVVMAAFVTYLVTAFGGGSSSGGAVAQSYAATIPGDGITLGTYTEPGNPAEVTDGGQVVATALFLLGDNNAASLEPLLWTSKPDVYGNTDRHIYSFGGLSGFREYLETEEVRVAKVELLSKPIANGNGVPGLEFQEGSLRVTTSDGVEGYLFGITIAHLPHDQAWKVR